MGYVRDGSPDLFISYSHADDQGIDEKPGWVTSLYRLLRIEIDRKLGKVGACNLWMDHRLAAGEMFDEGLDARVRASATMLIVLSTGYGKSSWCRREMELFHAKAAAEERGSPRVFVIEADRVVKPESLEKVQSVSFWSALPDNPKITSRLGNPRPNEDDPDHKPFFARLNSLTHDISASLEELKQAEAGKSTAAPKATVYLARGTDDVDDQYLEVREYLLQQGLRVLPQVDYPQEEARYVEAANKDLAESALFVQLLGSLPGKKLIQPERRDVTGNEPPDPVRRQVGAQHSLAVRAGRPILRWRSRTLALDRVENPEQARRLAEPDVLALELEEFKAMIVQRIEAILNPPTPASKRQKGMHSQSKHIFINADTPDLSLAERLGKTLKDLGAWVTLPYSPERDEGSTPLDYLTDQVKCCDAFMLIYGGAKGSWVSSQLLWTRKPQAERDTRAPYAVVHLPPLPKQPLNLLTPDDILCIEGQPFPNEGDLEAFIRSL